VRDRRLVRDDTAIAGPIAHAGRLLQHLSERRPERMIGPRRPIDAKSADLPLVTNGHGAAAAVETPIIGFGPIGDPNSSLSVQAAAAHELTHFYRWRDQTELVPRELFEIDEALTSLEAVLRFPRQLNEHDVRQLVADAIQRLQFFAIRRAEELTRENR